MNFTAGYIEALQDCGIDDDKAKQAVANNEKAQENFYTSNGALLAVKKLIQHIDFRAYDLELTPSILRDT